MHSYQENIYNTYMGCLQMRLDLSVIQPIAPWAATGNRDSQFGVNEAKVWVHCLCFDR